MAKTPTTKKEKATPKYVVELEMNGVKTKLAGDTVLEALTLFEKPPLVKSDLVISVSNGLRSRQHLIPIMKARRTFNNRTALSLLASNLSKLLG